MNIENYLSQLTEKYHILQSICHEGESMSVTEENRDIIFYQLAAARYGRDFMKFNIEAHKIYLYQFRVSCAQRFKGTVLDPISPCRICEP